MFKRCLESRLLSLAEQFPVVTLTGPRQSGKTTLCRKLFSHLRYFSLEDPDVRDMARDDPPGVPGRLLDGGRA